MATDAREPILARLLEIAAGIDGVKGAARNVPDVPKIARPAMIVHDGVESMYEEQRADLKGRLQRMNLQPQVWILLGTSGENVGTVANLYRDRLLDALWGDTELLGLLADGWKHYLGCSFTSPETSDAREARLELEFAFTYVFKRGS